MNNAFIVGNGKSRLMYTREILLSSPVFACNLAFRNFKVDYLFAKDKKMIDIIEQEYDGLLFVAPQDLNSGEAAILQAIKSGARRLWIYGFDSICETGVRKINNVYTNQDGYASSDTITSEDPAIGWWTNIFTTYPCVEFRFVGLPIIPDWIYPFKNVIFLV